MVQGNNVVLAPRLFSKDLVHQVYKHLNTCVTTVH